MSDPRLQFMRSIIESPEDDTPRLVLADWLDEHGDAQERAHAELIRVQCEIAKPVACTLSDGGYASCHNYNVERPPYRVTVWCPACQRRQNLQRRESGLLAAYRTTWLTPLISELTDYQLFWGAVIPDVLAGCEIGWHLLAEITVFRRGFIARAALRVSAVLEYGPALCRATPLERIEVTDRTPVCVHPLNSPRYHWSWFRHDYGKSPSTIPEEFRVDRYRSDFPTEQAARDWLSELALTWCRAEMAKGVPP